MKRFFGNLFTQFVSATIWCSLAVLFLVPNILNADAKTAVRNALTLYVISKHITRNFAADGSWDIATLEPLGYLHVIPPQNANTDYVILNGGGITGTSTVGGGLQFYEGTPTPADKAHFVMSTSTGATAGNMWDLTSREGSTSLTLRPQTGEINTNKVLNLGNVDTNAPGSFGQTINIGQLTASGGANTVTVALGNGTGIAQRTINIGSSTGPTAINLNGGTSPAFPVIYNPTGTLFLHTGGVAAATGNTFLGKGTGNLTLTGTNNTGIAAGVLAALTIGTNNTAIGQNALSATTTGGSNTALGYQAGQAYTTTSNNISIGSGVIGLNTDVSTIRIGAGVATSAATVPGASSAFIDGVFGKTSNTTTTRRAISVGDGGQLGTEGNMVINSGSLTLSASGSPLILTGGSGTCSLQASTAPATTSYTTILPSAIGTAGQLLGIESVAGTTANLSWQNPSVAGTSYMYAYRATNQTFGAAPTWQQVQFDTLTQGANYSTSTYLYTAPLTGKYLVTVNLSINAPNTSSTRELHLYSPATTGTAPALGNLLIGCGIAFSGRMLTDGGAVSLTSIVSLTAGQLLGVALYIRNTNDIVVGTSPLGGNANGLSNFSVQFISAT